MPPSKIRFVTACQQLLALGLVVAVLTPAASVISLDVVHDRPGDDRRGGLAADLSAYVRESARTSTVPDRGRRPDGHRVRPDGVLRRRRRARPQRPHQGRTCSAAAEGDRRGAVTSVPEPVAGYGAVGVTWEHGTKVAEDEISLQVRTRTGDTWSGWMDLEYHDDHGPDPGTAEARHARPGTDALLVGDVDDVQVQVESTTGDLPPDLKLAVIDPGTADQDRRRAARARHQRRRRRATAPPTHGRRPTAPLETEPGAGDDGSDQIALQAATFTPKPQIYSRAQWGADESMRDKSSLHYFEVHAGFVHHTVNANDYTRAEVPGILRSIYAYHTKSRGWSDIGYNFLVDRFGRIWEGRYGGIDRPVVGAHTLNYNDYSFAMSAIGNYDIKQPSQRDDRGVRRAVRLEALAARRRRRLDAASRSAARPSRRSTATATPRPPPARASTSTPGSRDIRRLAAEAQRGWAGRELESNLAVDAAPRPRGAPRQRRPGASSSRPAA